MYLLLKVLYYWVFFLFVMLLFFGVILAWIIVILMLIGLITHILNLSLSTPFVYSMFCTLFRIFTQSPILVFSFSLNYISIIEATMFLLGLIFSNPKPGL